MLYEYMTYEWSCDACGEVNASEFDGLPDGWETTDDGDFCVECQ